MPDSKVSKTPALSPVSYVVDVLIDKENRSFLGVKLAKEPMQNDLLAISAPDGKGPACYKIVRVVWQIEPGSQSCAILSAVPFDNKLVIW